jgi:hypothetical protein
VTSAATNSAAVAKGRSGRLAGRGVEVGDPDARRPLGGELLGDRPPDSRAPPPVDQRNFVIETPHARVIVIRYPAMPTISRALLVAAPPSLPRGAATCRPPQPVTVPATPQQNPQPYVSMTPLPASQSSLKETVIVITLRSRNGLEMKCCHGAGIIQSLRTPDLHRRVRRHRPRLRRGRRLRQVAVLRLP